MEHKINIKKLKERYEQLYTEKSKNFSLWDDIAKYCRIEKKNLETDVGITTYYLESM